MNKKTWLHKCASRLAEKADMDQDAAAAQAEECADFEEMTNGSEITRWLNPETAADEEMARWARQPPTTDTPPDEVSQ